MLRLAASWHGSKYSLYFFLICVNYPVNCRVALNVRVEGRLRLLPGRARLLFALLFVSHAGGDDESSNSIGTSPRSRA